MTRYIDADALLAELDKFAEDKEWRSKRTLRERWLRNQGIDIFRMGVRAFPTADVVPTDQLRDITSGLICGACDVFTHGGMTQTECVPCILRHIKKVIGEEVPE